MYKQSSDHQMNGTHQRSAVPFDYNIAPATHSSNQNGIMQQAYSDNMLRGQMDSQGAVPSQSMSTVAPGSASSMIPPSNAPHYGAMGYYFPAHQGVWQGPIPANASGMSFIQANMDMVTDVGGYQNQGNHHMSKSPTQKKLKREQVRRACIPCSSAKRKCDHGRPCKQCVKRNIQDSCSDVKPKKRNKISYEARDGSYTHNSGSTNWTESSSQDNQSNVPPYSAPRKRGYAWLNGGDPGIELQRKSPCSAQSKAPAEGLSVSNETESNDQQGSPEGTSTEYQQIKAIQNLSQPITRIKYSDDSLVMRCIFLNKAAALLFGTLGMSPQDLSGCDIRWVHPDDEPERMQSYASHFMTRKFPEEDIPFYSNFLSKSPAVIPRSALNSPTKESLDCENLVLIKTLRDAEQLVERHIRPVIPSELTCSLECLFRGKFFRFFRQLSEAEATARASEPNVTIDGEGTSKNPFAEFHVFSATICTFFVRNQDGRVVSSYDLATEVKPEEEVFVMPEYSEHFVDEMMEYKKADPLHTTIETSSSKNYTSRFSNQYVLLVESEYAQTEEGKKEYGQLL